MPTQRIRYKKIGTGLESIQTFSHPYNGAQYIVRLDATMWYVLDAHSEMVAISGHRTKKHEDLRMVKETLRGLGITLGTEKRARL